MGTVRGAGAGGRFDGAIFGKPDATGKSSGKLSGRNAKVFGPPKGEAWTWMTRELLCSPAWRSMSVNAHRLVDFLLVEHCNHAGKHNGHLKATYDQLVEWGLSRRLIRDAVEESEFLGLLKFERGGRWAMTNMPSVYKLTFFPDAEGAPATNEWKGKTAEAIREWKKDRARLQRAKRTRRPKVVDINGVGIEQN